MVNSSYDNGVVKVERFSDTFYVVCFKPEACRFEVGTEAYSALHSTCEQAELASSKGWNFMENNLDVGILAAARNRRVEVEEGFNILSALVIIANLIKSYCTY